MSKEFIISNIITILISVFGWYFAIKQINKQYKENMNLEKQKYKYEIKQKLAYDAIEQIINVMDKNTDLVAVIPLINENINIRNNSWLRDKLNLTWNEYRIATHKMMNILISRKLLLSDISDLVDELIFIQTELRKIWEELFNWQSSSQNIINNATDENLLNLCSKFNSKNQDLFKVLTSLNENIQERYLLNIFD